MCTVWAFGQVRQQGNTSAAAPYRCRQEWAWALLSVAARSLHCSHDAACAQYATARCINAHTHSSTSGKYACFHGCFADKAHTAFQRTAAQRTSKAAESYTAQANTLPLQAQAQGDILSRAQTCASQQTGKQVSAAATQLLPRSPFTATSCNDTTHPIPPPHTPLVGLIAALQQQRPTPA